MYLKYHFLSCIILSIFLFPFFGYYSLLVFILGFFIDIDHYLYDAIKTKNLNPFNSYKMHMDKNRIAKDQLHIFHILEFIATLILLTLFSDNIYLLLISMGLVLHLILDLIYYFYLIKNKVELKSTRALSLILWINKNI